MKLNSLKFKNKTIYTICALMTISALGLIGCQKQRDDVKKQDVNIEADQSKKISQDKEGNKDNKDYKNKDDIGNKKSINKIERQCSVKFMKKKINDAPKFNTKLKANKSNMMNTCIEGLGPDAEEEGVGYIYIEDLKKKEKYALTIVQKHQQNTPKYVEWFDDNNLMVILGSAYGTVSKGGNLYKINVNTGLTTEIYNTKDKKIQIVSVKRNINKLQLNMLVYDNDEFLNSHEERKDIIIK